MGRRTVRNPVTGNGVMCFVSRLNFLCMTAHEKQAKTSARSTLIKFTDGVMLRSMFSCSVRRSSCQSLKKLSVVMFLPVFAMLVDKSRTTRDPWPTSCWLPTRPGNGDAQQKQQKKPHRNIQSLRNTEVDTKDSNTTQHNVRKKMERPPQNRKLYTSKTNPIRVSTWNTNQQPSPGTPLRIGWSRIQPLSHQEGWIPAVEC